MKKETLFKHELNESIQANAAMNCLKNRNKPQQMNEALPLVAGAIRLAMPLLRPLITKIVKSLVMKAGAKLTGRQVAKMVIKNVANGKTLMKVGKKVGQTWTEIPAELKQEIAKTAINTFKEMRQPKQEVATQEQEETSEFDNRFALRKDLKGMANDVTKKAYMLIRKEYGDSMWRQLGMDDCDEQGLISQINDYQKYYGMTDPQEIVNKMLGRKATEQEETVDIPQLAEDVVASYRGRLSNMDEKERVNFISTMVMKKMGKSIDTLTPQEKKEIISAAKHSMWYVSEQEENTLNAYYSQDEPDYENDHHGIWLIINLMRKKGMLRAQGIEGRDDVDDGHAIDKAYDLIEQKLNEEGMWIGDDDHEAERFVSFFGDEIAAEAMKSAIHNQQSQEQEEISLDTEYFSDLEEQEAYYENFRAIAELVANQIDRENGKGIDNNMDTLFEIVREVWNNNPDDLYIWDFDDVQENDCYKLFDKYYEIIKNEYLKREHNNIMAATHDDLFDFSEQEEMPQMERHDMILEIAQVLDESFGVDDNDGDLDDIYYAVARFLNLMTYYTPESRDDIMNWCREWHEDIAEIINTPADGNVLKGFVDDAFECLLEEGGCPEFYDLPKEQVKQAIYKALCNTPESELPWGRHYAINSWTKANVQKIRKFLSK